MTVCPSDVDKPGSIECVCVLCVKPGFKERVYNGIRPCYLVDSPRLCSAVVQMLTVCLRNSGDCFEDVYYFPQH